MEILLSRPIPPTRRRLIMNSPPDNVAFGLGFNSVDIDVDATRSDFDGTLDWRYEDALLFFKFDF